MDLRAWSSDLLVKKTEKNLVSCWLKFENYLLPNCDGFRSLGATIDQNKALELNIATKISAGWWVLKVETSEWIVNLLYPC